MLSDASIRIHTQKMNAMANISVRKLDDHIYLKLRQRAQQHHVSMEEEARQIISQVVSAPERITDIFQKHFGHNNGVDLKLNAQVTPHDPMDFE